MSSKSFSGPLPGERFRLVLTREGTIDYVCTPHPGMFGMLSVGPALIGPKAAGPPRTIGAISPVSMAGLGTGWLLVLGLLSVAQLRVRAASFGRDLQKRRVPTEDLS